MTLSLASREHAAETLSRLVAEVRLELHVSAAETPASARLRAVAEELVRVASEVADPSGPPLLSLRELRGDAAASAAVGVELTPALLLRDEQGEDTGVRFAGAVEGQELGVLLDDILAVGRTGPALSPAARDELARLDRPLELRVLGAATCPRCATALRIAHALALGNPRLRVTGVDLEALPGAAPAGMQTVPLFVVPGRAPFAGPLPELVLLQRLLGADED